ncbi:uncharacterized protein LOC127096079 [Lathyrus oleraceus]|uniref:uncharacterized protein LOC127096079 n=1 Tax=Pisum sativum TaxID=3888 RepID=UPI0021D14BF5|nr:uncharacterized protein LOC127096079 [Pisum sativum]
MEHDHDKCRICSVNRLGCNQVRRELQELLDEGTIEILQNRNVDKDELEINVISPVFKLPEPVVIRYDSNKPKTSPSLVIKPTGPVPYSSDKAVPFRYNPVAVQDGVEVPLPSTAVTNIADFNLASPILLKGTTTTVTDKGKRVIPTDEDTGFLRIIKKSDYNIIDQLHQTHSKISILSLLMSSSTHRSALHKLLAQAHVTHDITIDQFDGVIANITACNHLSFSREDLTKDGQDHNRALHISVKCQEDTLSRVLVDTGSSMNVLPKRMLAKLAYQGVEMRPSALIVKAFDGSRRTVIVEVDLSFLIGPHVFEITFQVMDINPNYSCLLGRPWIHATRVVTSTLHQKMKFVIDDKLVIVSDEEDLMVSHLSSFSYIEADEDALETSFQSLEIANDVFMEVKEPKGKGITSFASWKKAR